MAFGVDTNDDTFVLGSDGTRIGNVTDSLKVNVSASALPSGAATSANQAAEQVLLGALTETAPASDTASSGLNGRLQRIAQRLTSLIALIPNTIGTAFFSRISDGTNTMAVKPASTAALAADPAAVVSLSPNSPLPTGTNNIGSLTNITGTISLPTGASTATNQASELVLLGAVTETAPASDTASSGLNGRTQRIAQRLTSLIALIPSTIGIAWFSRISNGTNTAGVSANSDLQVTDVCNSSGSHGAVTIGLTAVLASVSGTNLGNRKSLTVYNNGTVLLYWGLSNAVTTSTGTPIIPGTTVIFAVGPTTSIYLIAGTASQNTRITEMA